MEWDLNEAEYLQLNLDRQHSKKLDPIHELKAHVGPNREQNEMVPPPRVGRGPRNSDDWACVSCVS